MAHQFWLLFLMRVTFLFVGSKLTWPEFREKVEPMVEWESIIGLCREAASNPLTANSCKVKAIKILRDICKSLDPVANIRAPGDSPNIHSALRFAYHELYGPSEVIGLADCKRIIDTIVEQMLVENAANLQNKGEEPPTLGSLLRKVQERNARDDVMKDGWIEWNGGECPVPKGTKVDVRHRSGIVECYGPSWILRWTHLKQPDDIIAYRVVGEQAVR